MRTTSKNCLLFTTSTKLNTRKSDYKIVLFTKHKKENNIELFLGTNHYKNNSKKWSNLEKKDVGKTCRWTHGVLAHFFRFS